MKKRFITCLVAVAVISGLGGFVIGIRAMNNTEEKLLELFSDDVFEVRQGRLAGSLIATTDNKSLSEIWEEICSDIIRVALAQQEE